MRFSKALGLCELAAPVATGEYASIGQLRGALDSCPAATASAGERRAAIDGTNTEWRPICLDRTSVESDVDPAD